MWLISVPVAAVSFVAGFVIFSPKGKPRADGLPPAGTLQGVLAGRFSAASEDRVSALFAAFEEREPLRRDAAIFRAIEQLQPGDALGALGDLAALIRRVEKLPRELWPHLTEAVLERWLTLDGDGALRWMEGALKLGALGQEKHGFDRWDGATLQSAMHVLARHHPEWALRHVLTLPENGAPGARRPDMLSGLFVRLGEREPSRARALLREISNEKDRDSARTSLMLGLARADSAAALAFARSEMDAKAVSKALVQLAFMMNLDGGSQDPASMRQWIDEFGDPRTKTLEATVALGAATGSSRRFPYDWLTGTLEETVAMPREDAARLNSSWLGNVCRGLASRDPERLREWVESLSGETRARANAAYFSALVGHDREAAFAWLAHLSPEAFGAPDAAKQAFAAAATRTPEKLSTWIATQPPGPLRDAALAARASGLASYGRPGEALPFYRDVLAFDSDGDIAARLAFSASQKDPTATAAWLAGLPPGIQQERAARTAAEAWTWRDPIAAAEWVDSLPGGPLRDSAIAGYAPVAMHADPAAAAASVERIAATATKQAAAEKVFEVWLAENPIAARRWLRSLAGVESAWVEKRLRSTP